MAKGNIILPTTNGRTNATNPVVGFHIKTIIIQDLLCIGFSGQVNEIESLLTDLQDFYMHRKVSCETLMEIYHELNQQYSVSAIYALAEENDEKHQIMVVRSGNWIFEDSRLNFHMLSAGSGASDWTSEILLSAAFQSEDDIDAPFSRQRALQSCIKWIMKERITDRHLINGWGGGFDLVYFENGKLQRLDNFAYAFYAVDISNEDTVLTPISVIHQRYTNGKLIIRHFEKNGFQTYAIPEFNNKTDYSEDQPDCYAREVISCIHLFDGGKHLLDLGVLFWDSNPNAELAFSTTGENGQFGIRFREIYHDKLKEAITSFTS
ncbi:hypothetical protein QWY86_10855 [Pedobacter aquatilis]|uniref:hypothetical protein n=1 Tax=Pedobacter aquatilis TaxID=351343 RepID=UPI0025B40E3E|nr:hypothetical protein [Pedobacter aquatilis]MDN3587170.1 hypothetical protein [Pedobacter aquatilis]